MATYKEFDTLSHQERLKCYSGISKSGCSLDFSSVFDRSDASLCCILRQRSGGGPLLPTPNSSPYGFHLPASSPWICLPVLFFPFLYHNDFQHFAIFFFSWHTDLFGLHYGLCHLWCYFQLWGDSSRFHCSLSRATVCSNKLSVPFRYKLIENYISLE